MVVHRVGRVLSFFSSRRGWDSPTPRQQASVPPPPLVGREGHTRWREKGWQSPNSDEGTFTCGTLFIYVLCGLSYRPANHVACRAGTTTLCRSWLYPPVRDLWIRHLGRHTHVDPANVLAANKQNGRAVWDPRFFLTWLNKLEMRVYRVSDEIRLAWALSQNVRIRYIWRDVVESIWIFEHFIYKEGHCKSL